MASAVFSHKPIRCTWLRPGNKKPHFCIVLVGEEHENYGESAICNLDEAQYWIKYLKHGDVVYVTPHIRRSNESGKLLCDASPNAFQPLFQGVAEGFRKKEDAIQAELPTPKLEIVPDSNFRRIDTYLNDPQQIQVFEALADHLSIKHAGHLLLTYAIGCLPKSGQGWSGEEIHAYLTK